MRSPAPDAQLQVADTSLELVARYPVEIRRASEMDDRVTRTVVELISSDADLQNAIAGAPKIRAAIKG